MKFIVADVLKVEPYLIFGYKLEEPEAKLST